MKCEHLKCHSSERMWVPTYVNEEGDELEKIKPHYYCVQCGEIEYKGQDKARHYGYFSNILGDIKRYLEIEAKKGSNVKITSAVFRLVMMELHKIDDFTDKFSKPFCVQKKEFIRVLKKYIPCFSSEFYNNFFDPNPPRYDEESVNYYGKYYEELEEQYAQELALADGEEEYAFF
ncbi:MAG: hypothetical protein KAU14_00170 [Thermoplasmata archaeon]|nr:hypothetical protein [Thermoplasmata archaeon]